MASYFLVAKPRVLCKNERPQLKLQWQLQLQLPGEAGKCRMHACTVPRLLGSRRPNNKLLRFIVQTQTQRLRLSLRYWYRYRYRYLCRRLILPKVLVLGTHTRISSFFHSFALQLGEHGASASLDDDYDYDELVMHVLPHIFGLAWAPICADITFWPLDVGHVLDHPIRAQLVLVRHFYFSYCQQLSEEESRRNKTFPTLQICRWHCHCCCYCCFFSFPKQAAIVVAFIVEWLPQIINFLLISVSVCSAASACVCLWLI